MNLVKISFLNALGTIAYIVGIVLIMFNVVDKTADNTIYAPMLALMLFVLSAAVTGGLVLGRPVMLYLSDKKAEAIKLFLYTVGWLAAGTIIALIINISINM
jgi:hypothetical protein